MIYRFADCELDTERFELRRGGAVQKVEPQVFEILRYLLERHDQFVAKEELHKAIWQGRVVSDAAMSSRIKAARRAIGDSGAEQRFIRTVHGRGLSFIAPVTLEDRRRPDDRSPGQGPKPAAGEADAAEPPQEVLVSADVHLNELLNGDGSAAAAEAALLSARAMLRTEIERSGGQVVAAEGGGITARFGSAVDALECAASLQRWHSRAAMASSPRLRIGLCDLLDEPEKAVAVAARLQCFAAPGEICITGRIAERAHRKYRFASRPVDAGLAHDLNELDLSIVEAAESPPEAERPGIPQLQCGSPVQPREPSIVILPFDAVGTDATTVELAQGLRIDIQNRLIRISRIMLIAAASANAFRGSSPELAARSLGVRYVLHGVIQLVEKRARVSVELVDTLSARIVWAEQFDITVTDTFTIQDEITRKVIAALDVKLYSGEQARIWYQALTDPKVVRVFYRGVRLFFQMEREAMAEARRAFEAVAEMRPQSSIGATWAALCHWMDYLRRWGSSQSESKRLARQWAEAAAPLPDVDGQAHTVLAHVRLLDREFDAALEAGRQALVLRPGCANANGFFGNVLHYCGEQDQAITHLRKGIRLQPVYPPFFADALATAYFAAAQPEAAMAVAKEALRVNPRDLQARLVLAAAAQMKGNRELARAFARETLGLEPAFSVGAHCDGQPYRYRETIDAMKSAWLAAELPA